MNLSQRQRDALSILRQHDAGNRELHRLANNPADIIHKLRRKGFCIETRLVGEARYALYHWKGAE